MKGLQSAVRYVALAILHREGTCQADGCLAHQALPLEDLNAQLVVGVRRERRSPLRKNGRNDHGPFGAALRVVPNAMVGMPRSWQTACTALTQESVC